MKKTALVVGATGLVGQSLIAHLATADHIEKVIAITRRPVTYSYSNVINIVVDFENLENYSSAFMGDFLFSCLGSTVKQAGSIAAQRRVDLDYQFKAAQLAANNGVSHYLLVSSYGADANSKNAYLKMKGELEEKVKALAFKRISIFQPSLLMGKRANMRTGEKIAEYVLPIICMLPFLRRFRPISGNEVAKKMVLVSQQADEHLKKYTLDEVFLNSL
jgi:uncharacterized protein YbjT (DUF2867 family)